MNLKGEITFQYNDGYAKDIAKLIQMDNEIVPKTLKITTMLKGSDQVVTNVESAKPSTFFSTIDDLVFSEKLIFEIMET